MEVGGAAPPAPSSTRPSARLSIFLEAVNSTAMGASARAASAVMRLHSSSKWATGSSNSASRAST